MRSMIGTATVLNVGVAAALNVGTATAINVGVAASCWHSCRVKRWHSCSDGRWCSCGYRLLHSCAEGSYTAVAVNGDNCLTVDVVALSNVVNFAAVTLGGNTFYTFGSFALAVMLKISKYHNVFKKEKSKSLNSTKLPHVPPWVALYNFQSRCPTNISKCSILFSPTAHNFTGKILYLS